MKVYSIRICIITFLILTVFFDCAKEKKEVNSCLEISKQLEGTYSVTVTSCPRQTLQEGDVKDVLVFIDNNCYSGTLKDTSEIKFNNLFRFFDCSTLKLIDHKRFVVTYEDRQEWYGAPIKGEGSIVNGIFHFEGTILTSEGEYPIILDGEKTSSDRRTDAC